MCRRLLRPSRGRGCTARATGSAARSARTAAATTASSTTTTTASTRPATDNAGDRLVAKAVDLVRGRVNADRHPAASAGRARVRGRGRPVRISINLTVDVIRGVHEEAALEVTDRGAIAAVVNPLLRLDQARQDVLDFLHAIGQGLAVDLLAVVVTEGALPAAAAAAAPALAGALEHALQVELGGVVVIGDLDQ